MRWGSREWGQLEGGSVGRVWAQCLFLPTQPTEAPKPCPWPLLSTAEPLKDVFAPQSPCPKPHSLLVCFQGRALPSAPQPLPKKVPLWGTLSRKRASLWSSTDLGSNPNFAT